MGVDISSKAKQMRPSTYRWAEWILKNLLEQDLNDPKNKVALLTFFLDFIGNSGDYAMTLGFLRKMLKSLEQ